MNPWQPFSMIQTRDGLEVRRAPSPSGFEVVARDSRTVLATYEEADAYEALCRYRSDVRVKEQGEG